VEEKKIFGSFFELTPCEIVLKTDFQRDNYLVVGYKNEIYFLLTFVAVGTPPVRRGAGRPVRSPLLGCRFRHRGDGRVLVVEGGPGLRYLGLFGEGSRFLY